MTKMAHNLYIGTMVFIVIFVTFYFIKTGYSYYSLPLEERFYHDKYDWFKPSGVMGQGIGILGTFLIAFGVGIYIARKRYSFLSNFIRLKYLLEFHIFLCTLGPILILFHTTFKFGGVVSIAFWSMVAVVLSGVVGRFIYIQIPRSIEGRELSISDIQTRRKQIENLITNNDSIDKETNDLMLSSNVQQRWGIKTYFRNQAKLRRISYQLEASELSSHAQTEILDLVREEMNLASKVGRLQQMQKLFKYWHVVHMPFAIIMLVIVVIHVIVSIALGYKWIF